MPLLLPSPFSAAATLDSSFVVPVAVIVAPVVITVFAALFSASAGAAVVLGLLLLLLLFLLLHTASASSQASPAKGDGGAEVIAVPAAPVAVEIAPPVPEDDGELLLPPLLPSPAPDGGDGADVFQKTRGAGVRWRERGAR